MRGEGCPLPGARAPSRQGARRLRAAWSLTTAGGRTAPSPPRRGPEVASQRGEPTWPAGFAHADARRVFHDSLSPQPGSPQTGPGWGSCGRPGCSRWGLTPAPPAGGYEGILRVSRGLGRPHSEPHKLLDKENTQHTQTSGTSLGGAGVLPGRSPQRPGPPRPPRPPELLPGTEGQGVGSPGVWVGGQDRSPLSPPPPPPGALCTSGARLRLHGALGTTPAGSHCQRHVSPTRAPKPNVATEFKWETIPQLLQG